MKLLETMEPRKTLKTLNKNAQGPRSMHSVFSVSFRRMSYDY
jgi:hypothetical protein